VQTEVEARNSTPGIEQGREVEGLASYQRKRKETREYPRTKKAKAVTRNPFLTGEKRRVIVIMTVVCRVGINYPVGEATYY
jgi:hypothetical protein